DGEEREPGGIGGADGREGDDGDVLPRLGIEPPRDRQRPAARAADLRAAERPGVERHPRAARARDGVERPVGGFAGHRLLFPAESVPEERASRQSSETESEKVLGGVTQIFPMATPDSEGLRQKLLNAGRAGATMLRGE